MPLAAAMQQYVFGPMGLRETQAFDTPQIPEPALHTYSSERREALRIPASVGFYEDSTFWDPSWTTGRGAVETTDIADMARSMEIVGAGTLVSKASYAAEVGPNLAGVGHTDPKCPACRKLTATFNYGLGVVNFGPWITQTKSFAGSTATVGYLPSHKLTIAVATTFLPAAYDSDGNFKDASVRVFGSLANSLAPGTLPPLPKE
jgi:CubicO group peptidase (beta-lactamase class C family)